MKERNDKLVKSLVFFCVILTLISLFSVVLTYQLYNKITQTLDPPILPENPVYRVNYFFKTDPEENTFTLVAKLFSAELDDWDTKVTIISPCENTLKSETQEISFSDGYTIVRFVQVPFECKKNISIGISYSNGSLWNSLELFSFHFATDKMNWFVTPDNDSLVLEYSGLGNILYNFD